MAVAKDLAEGQIENQIKILLAERDWNMKDLERATGLEYTTIRRFCDKRSQNINKPVLSVICNALNCQPGDIFVYVPDEG